MTQETFVADVRRFTEAVGCTTDQYNTRQLALYIGLQLEEMAETLEAVFPKGVCTMFITELHQMGKAFKRGDMDKYVDDANRLALLDAGVDLAWVTVGAMLSQGADVLGAMGEVARSNMSKLIIAEDGTPMAVKDGNGKVCKPESFTPPHLFPFIAADKGV